MVPSAVSKSKRLNTPSFGMLRIGPLLMKSKTSSDDCRSVTWSKASPPWPAAWTWLALMRPMMLRRLPVAEKSSSEVGTAGPLVGLQRLYSINPSARSQGSAEASGATPASKVEPVARAPDSRLALTHPTLSSVSPYAAK
jgi:hypothetical protein